MPMIETIDEYLMTAVHSESGIAVKIVRRSTYDVIEYRYGAPTRVKVRIDWLTDGGQPVALQDGLPVVMTDKGPQRLQPQQGMSPLAWY